MLLLLFILFGCLTHIQAIPKEDLSTGPARHAGTDNVGPVYIIEPWDTVWCGDTVSVIAEICNLGDSAETFDVEALVDSSGTVVYTDTQTVTNLLGDSCTTVNFIDWVVPQIDGVLSYTLTVATLLAGDTIPGNDTLAKPVVIWCAGYRNVAVEYIAEPWDTVWCGDTAAVEAYICNYGDTTETFPVAAVIDSFGVVVYSDTQTVTDLLVDSCTTVSFTDWIVPFVQGVIPHTLTVTTLLPGDIDPTNDTLSKSIAVWCAAYHDIAVDYISDPWDTVWCGNTSPVAVGVCNYGDSMETFDIAMAIDSSGVGVYADTQTVLDLEPDSCVLVNFADWIVPGGHLVTYRVSATVILPPDMDPTNDTLSSTSVNWCPEWHDVTVDSIKAPPDTVFCDSAVPVTATVCNCGDSVETFDIEAVIRDTLGVLVYVDTVTVDSLIPDSITDVSFQDWLVPTLDSTYYNVAVTALLDDDDYPPNDTATKTVFCWCTIGVSEDAIRSIADSGFRLDAPRPSPAREDAEISFMLPSPSRVTLRIYDLRGTVVKTVINESQPAGTGSVRWNGTDTRGNPVASGVYFCEFTAEPHQPGLSPFRSTGKLALLR